MSKKRSMSNTIMVEEGAVIETQEVQDDVSPPVENEDPEYENLFDAIQEIKKRSEVIGYILEGESKAAVDLNDSAKIIEYATLSSQTFEAAKTLASTFRLEDTENIVVEGKNLKLLCLELGQNKISIFMQKGTDHTDILRVLATQPGYTNTGS